MVISNQFETLDDNNEHSHENHSNKRSIVHFCLYFQTFFFARYDFVFTCKKSIKENEKRIPKLEGLKDY